MVSGPLFFFGGNVDLIVFFESENENAREAFVGVREQFLDLKQKISRLSQ